MTSLSFNHISVEFFNRAEPDLARSREAGRPVFKEVDMVRIRKIADKNYIHEAPANERSLREKNGQWSSYAERFPAQYQAYKAKVEYIGDGTPLSEAAFMTEAQRMEYRALGILTIEKLADLPAQIKSKLGMTGIEMQTKAKTWLSRASDAAPDMKLAQENADLRARLEALELRSVSDPAPQPAPEAAPSDEQLKALIKERTGSAPRGTPSRETLLRMLQETEQAAA